MYIYWKIALQNKKVSQVETKFRTLFLKHLPPIKTTIWKNVKKYERDGTSLKWITEDQQEELSQVHKKAWSSMAPLEKIKEEWCKKKMD